jgi:hypothetical protein
MKTFQATEIYFSLAVLLLSGAMAACVGNTSGAALEVSSVSPAVGSVYGGAQLTVLGQGFEAGDHIQLGGVECLPAVVISATEIHCTLPRHPAGVVDVVLERGSTLDETALPNGFTFGCPGGNVPGLSVWANDGGDKVTQDELRMGCDTNSVKNSLWDGQTIKLFGARNEVVNFNLVLESAQAATSGVSVSFDTLTGPGGSVIGSSDASGDGVFNWAGRNIENFYVRYLQIKGLSFIAYSFYDERQAPRRFQRPWVGAGAPTGTWTDRPDHDKFYPDIAVPLEMHPSFDIAANTNQSIWSDIYIPKTATPGLYSGTVTVRKGSTILAQVPVQLTVRGFTLPEVPSAKSMIHMGYSDLAKRYLGAFPADPVSGATLKTIRDRYFQVAHRHKLSLVDQNDGYGAPSVDSPRPEWEGRLNGQLFTSANGYDGPGVATGNNIYAVGMYNSWTWSSGSESDMHAHTDAWEQWFRDHSPATDRFLVEGLRGRGNGDGDDESRCEERASHGCSVNVDDEVRVRHR